MPAMGKLDVFLAEWADALGKKQKDFVRETGLSKGYVSQLWGGRHDKTPSQKTLTQLAECLGIHPSALLIHPKTPEARAIRAMAKIPKAKQDTALEMLEGLTEKKR